MLSVIALVLIASTYLYKEYSELDRKFELLEKVKKLHPVTIKPSNMKDGDIIFQQSLSSQSEAIKLATHSNYTHCGIIYKVDGNYFVFEAIEPARLTSLVEWMGRGKGGEFLTKRLRNADHILNDSTLKKMKEIGERFKGKHYDSYFEWTNDKVYCSELVWKIYKEATGLEVGKLQKLKDFDLSSEVVKQKMKERYGTRVPLDMTVISPASIFNSDLLTTVE